MHERATSVHCALASLERLFLVKKSGRSTVSSRRFVSPESFGKVCASYDGMMSSFDSRGFLSVFSSSLIAQK